MNSQLWGLAIGTFGAVLMTLIRAAVRIHLQHVLEKRAAAGDPEAMKRLAQLQPPDAVGSGPMAVLLFTLSISGASFASSYADEAHAEQAGAKCNTSADCPTGSLCNPNTKQCEARAITVLPVPFAPSDWSLYVQPREQQWSERPYAPMRVNEALWPRPSS